LRLFAAICGYLRLFAAYLPYGVAHTHASLRLFAAYLPHA